MPANLGPIWSVLFCAITGGVHLECSGVQSNGNLVKKKKVHYVYFQNKFYKIFINIKNRATQE